MCGKSTQHDAITVERLLTSVQLQPDGNGRVIMKTATVISYLFQHVSDNSLLFTIFETNTMYLSLLP